MLRSREKLPGCYWTRRHSLHRFYNQEQQGHVGSGPKNARVGGTGYQQSREEIEPLFTSGNGQKRTQGKSLWNLEGVKLFIELKKMEADL
jgi:hypothetical protein